MHEFQITLYVSFVTQLIERFGGVNDDLLGEGGGGSARLSQCVLSKVRRSLGVAGPGKMQHLKYTVCPGSSDPT